MILPYLKMVARVTIGSVVFNHVNALKIQETITELGNTATVMLPRNYHNQLDGKAVLQVIKPGDTVKIESGYDGQLETEFTGYVSSIDAEMPIVVHCEDGFYPLKQNTLVKVWPKISLKEMLTAIMPGYTIDCPGQDLGKFQINNASTYEVLRKIQQDFGLYTRIIGKKLIVGFSYDWQPGTRKWLYHRQKNVRSSNLAWKTKEDARVCVRVEYWEGKKKKVHIAGDPSRGASTQKIGTIAPSLADAKNIGKSVLNKIEYSGFTGSITGFGLPRTHAGDTLELQNNLEPEKNGNYLVSKTAITYDGGGWSRENTLAFKLS